MCAIVCCAMDARLNEKAEKRKIDHSESDIEKKNQFCLINKKTRLAAPAAHDNDEDGADALTSHMIINSID